jgi:hypothetical protein
MKKKYLAILVFGIVIVAGLGIFILYEMMPHYYGNPNIPNGFQYTSRSDKLPEQYLIYHNNDSFDTDVIYKENNKFYCKITGKEPLRIDYFSYSPGAGMIGGWYYRYALSCGYAYVIVDGADSFGTNIYGPFLRPG